jgi:hypothetical protein
MKIETKTQIMAPGHHLPFEVVSLVLQGGGALEYLESPSPKRVIAGRSKPGLPEDADAIEWTRRYINDFRTFAKMARSAAEMTDMLRVRNPNAIGFPASDGLFEMSTEVATGEIAPVG